jgi:hypothetical protein
MASQVHILHDAGGCMLHGSVLLSNMLVALVSAGRCLGCRASVAERAGLGFERDAAMCMACVAGPSTPGLFVHNDSSF